MGRAVREVTPLRPILLPRKNSLASIASASGDAGQGGFSSCPVCSSPPSTLTSSSTPTSSPTSPSSRMGSWFSSFSSSASSSSLTSSSSASSIGTALTTPSSSPVKASSSGPIGVTGASANVLRNWLRVRAATNASQTQVPAHGQVQVQAAAQGQAHCTCGNGASPRPYTVLTPIEVEESPLSLNLLRQTHIRGDGGDSNSDPSQSTSAFSSSSSSNASGTLDASDASGGASTGLVNHLTNFLTLANKFQSAYLQATVFAQVEQVTMVGYHHRDYRYSGEFDEKDVGKEGETEKDKEREKERQRMWKEEAKMYREFREKERVLKSQQGEQQQEEGRSVKLRKRRLRPVGFRASGMDIRRVFGRHGRVGREDGVQDESLKQAEAGRVNGEGVGTSDGSPSAEDDRSRSADRKESDLPVTNDNNDLADPTWIPLLPLFSSRSTSNQKLLHQQQTQLPRTKLPYPLPFPIVFKPQAPLTLSPMRRVVREGRAAQATKTRAQREDEEGEAFYHSNTGVGGQTGRFARRLSSSPTREYGYESSGSRRQSPMGTSRSSSSPPVYVCTYSDVDANLHHNHSHPSDRQRHPIPRPRYVANPVYLRVKALNNRVSSVEAQRMGLMGKGMSGIYGNVNGSANGNGGGKMKEKVIGMAYEDTGRSLLGLGCCCTRMGVAMGMTEMGARENWGDDEVTVVGAEDREEFGDVDEDAVKEILVVKTKPAPIQTQKQTQAQVQVQRGRPATPVMFGSHSTLSHNKSGGQQQNVQHASASAYPEAGYVRRGRCVVRG
ncbi:hypothetical protein K435DRAFT_481325 [Dendrothele bispora CBS 962.96]|uniref:Uncharacterized protein n=1 Tax=Dendrothele bispora (strain CBS 962.96) TaxID=1314807 RepID=A0A4S8MTI1_DENBC|nr:hypothetical protein K435DRAFT_481325 [Dendrothele bispora CBS 962.96]